MVSIVDGSVLIECDCCCFVSISTIRLLKNMITETIKSNATKMINKIQAFFLMCVAIIKKILYRKISSRRQVFANLELDNQEPGNGQMLNVTWTKSGQELK